MPFQEPNRRDSWPPTILRLHDDDNKDNDLLPDDIDDNPFAYFLTSPPEDDDVDFFEDLSAGIEAEGPSLPPVREVSPSSLQRTPLDQNPDSHLARALSFPSTLRDFTLLHERGKKERYSGAPDSDLDRTIAVALLRGRRAARPVGSGSGRGRGRGQTRSLSASKGHAWREPSPEMVSIPEEREDEDEDIDDVPALGSDANDSEMEGRNTKAGKGQGRKKMVKRVHWADLPVRDT